PTMVDRPLPLPRHAAMRHPLGLPGVLGPRRLQRVPLHAPRPGRARRSAVRGRPDVDVRHDGLSRGGNDHQHAAPRADGSSGPALRGGRLTMASEPMLAAPPVAIVPRVHVSRSTVLSDYMALTKPDVNLLIAITTASAFGLGVPAAASHFPWMRLLHTLAGTVLVASGAGALNQWGERLLDAPLRPPAPRPGAAGPTPTRPGPPVRAT